jgi:uncharacterized membrane protein YdfJ with MMPL/SSD domain
MCSASFIDCFVVRPLLVPALMLILENHNWWPATMPPTLEKIDAQDYDECETQELQAF